MCIRDSDVTDESFKKLAERTEYDVLLAGFPCQAFSRIGLKQGFRDVTKGTIFFDIAEIIDRTMPKVVFLENVCLLYTSDAADEEDSVDLGGRRHTKKKKRKN